MDIENLRNKEEEVKRLYAFVSEQVLAGLFKSEIIEKLIELGVDKNTASELVDEMESRMQRMRKKVIMVVTSDLKEKESLIKELKFAGYEVIGTDNSEQGFILLKKYVPDLIIIDRDAPQIDSHKFIKSLRKDPIGRKVPIFILCERKLMKDSFSIHHLIDFIEKPYQVSNVSEKAKRILFLPRNTTN